MEYSSETNQIMEHMGDEISKQIYQDRIAYNSGNTDALESIMNYVLGGKELIDFLKKYNGNLYIFGAGILGKEFLETWGEKYSFCGFIDNEVKKQGNILEGKPVVSCNDIIKKKHDIGIVIVNKFCYDEIRRQLTKSGVGENHIFNFGNYYTELNRRQYFDIEDLNKNELINFVDCGALDGKTTVYLSDWYKNYIKKIWLFEPDRENVEKCYKQMANLDCEFEIFEKAVWSSEKSIKFSELGNGMSGIDINGNVLVEATCLDKVIPYCDNLYIKMDIEGAELEALKGAEDIICKCKPKLAICVYHKVSDIETIPKLILKYNSNYKLYLRHYSLTKNETVLYAL